MRILKSWSNNDVENGRMLDVRVGDQPVHWLIFAGIAKPEWNIDDSDIQRDDVLIDLGVDVTQMLNYTATVGLATIGNSDSDFLFGTDAVTVEQTAGSRLFLRVKVALSGTSSLNRFGYQAHVKAVINDPLISGTIRWQQGIESHARNIDLFAITANQVQWQPGGLGPNLIPVPGAVVEIDAPALQQGTYEVGYRIRNIPVDTPLYVQADPVPGAFVPADGGLLQVSSVTPSDAGLVDVAGPITLTGPSFTVGGVDFVMTLQPAPR
jgi:hypothetical protein